MQWVSKILFAALFLWLAYWQRRGGILHNVIAYLAAITVMIWVFAIPAALIIGRIPSKGYVAPLLGLFAGAFVGIVVGIFVGYRASSHLWLYWTLVLIVTAIMAFLPPLI